MRNTRYEVVYIIRPNIDKKAKAALIERFDAILKDNGAEVIRPRDWERRRFAYEMNGYRGGTYYIVRVSSPSSTDAVNEFDRLVRINNDIICRMIVKKEA